MVEAIANAVPPRAAALYLLIVMSAAFVPSTLATIMVLILNTLPLEAALLTIDVALVVDSAVLELLPTMVVTPTRFGLAMLLPYSPKTMLNTILCPALTPPRDVNAAAAVVAFVPPLAMGSMPVTCVVRSTPDSVPPSVSEPDVVTVPVSVMPLTVPVPPTEVTVPVPAVEEIVKLGYVPVTVVAPEPVSDTI